MTNKEILEIVKATNKLVDELAGLDTTSPAYADIMDAIGMNIDCITIECPRWKYYKAWELKVSHRTGHYWVVFAQ